MQYDTEMDKLLWQAVDSSFGLIVKVDDQDSFKRRFYTARTRAKQRGVLDFNQLSCIVSPTNPTDEMWIVKNIKEQLNGKETGTGLGKGYSAAGGRTQGQVGRTASELGTQPSNQDAGSSAHQAGGGEAEPDSLEAILDRI